MTFDDEVMGPLVGALSGTTTLDPVEELQPTLDVWASDRWLLSGKAPVRKDPLRKLVRSFRFNDDGDPAHEQADQRAKENGVDVVNDETDLLKLARSQIGAPYIWSDLNPVGPEGGPGSGFDCSGFTQWVLSRFGISTTHLSSAQQDQFAYVAREDLQPGDLVFYHYTDRNGPGNTADHVEVYIGNGQTIGSSGGGVMVRNVNWDAFVGGGATGIDAKSGATTTERGRRGGPQRAEAPDLSQVPLALAPGESQAVIGTYGGMMADLLMPEKLAGTRRQFKGRNGSIERQLYQGFLDAGRPDLAKLVGTPAFTAWVNAESGYDPTATSPPNNHGLANDGLFQIWRGHSFNSSGQVSGMSPYEQAMMVARYFDLTPEDVQRYYEQIRAGTYGGWG